MPLHREMQAGAGGENCPCLECPCKTKEECDDPRYGCKCSGKCRCNPNANSLSRIEERELELVGS